MEDPHDMPESGLYMISPDPSRGEFVVYCDMRLPGRGWTIISRRANNLLNFNVGKEQYVSGFGRYNSNFWLGLERIKSLTESTVMELWVGLESFENIDSVQNWTPQDTWAHARYKFFFVGDKASDYTLTVGQFDHVNSTVGDSFSTVHNGKRFSHCASRGGWWYNTCNDSSLTGVYYNSKTVTGDAGITWEGWYGNNVSLKSVVMAVRPAN